MVSLIPIFIGIMMVSPLLVPFGVFFHWGWFPALFALGFSIFTVVMLVKKRPVGCILYVLLGLFGCFLVLISK